MVINHWLIISHFYWWYIFKNKNCDWIVANDVSKKNIGFNSDYNEVTIHYNDFKKNKETLSHKKKSEISEEIVDRIVTHMN